MYRVGNGQVGICGVDTLVATFDGNNSTTTFAGKISNTSSNITPIEIESTGAYDNHFNFRKTSNGGGNARINIFGRRESSNSDCAGLYFHNMYSGTDRNISRIISNTTDSNGLSGTLRFATSNGGTLTDALTLAHNQVATFSGGVWIAGAPGGAAAVTNGGKAFGFVTANNSTAGTPKISFAGGLSDGHYAAYIVTTGTRSNANAKVSVAIVTFTKGYNNTVSCGLVTLAGQTMGSTNNSSGGTIDFVVTGDGSSGGSGVPTASTCMQIGGNPNHGVTVMCHTT
jgi:hypothetical protein